MGNPGLSLFHICGDDGVVGEDIWAWSSIEGVASGDEAAAFGVEKDEVVGEISGRKDEILYVESMKGLAC